MKCFFLIQHLYKLSSTIMNVFLWHTKRNDRLIKVYSGFISDKKNHKIGLWHIVNESRGCLTLCIFHFNYAYIINLLKKNLCFAEFSYLKSLFSLSKSLECNLFMFICLLIAKYWILYLLLYRSYCMLDVHRKSDLFYINCIYIERWNFLWTNDYILSGKKILVIDS